MKGGARPGAGRKPKADEIELIEKLKPLDELAFKALSKGVTNGDYQFLKLFMDYRFGKPTENVQHSGEMGIVWNEIKKYGTNREADDRT